MEIDTATMSEVIPTVVDTAIVPEATPDAPVPEVVTDEPTPDAPVETPEIIPEAEPEKTDEPTPDDDKPDEAKPDEPKTDEPEAVTFDAESPELLTKVNETLDKYELPQEIVAAFDALKAKAEAVPADSFTEYADYGDSTAVKTLLDRQTQLDSVTEVEPGQYRPNTDKFAQELHKNSPDKADWLAYDVMQLPSSKYQGLNKFEEGIADALAKEGDTVQSVIGRYHQTIAAIKSGAEIASDAPQFVPPQLRDAYWSLSKEERDEIDSFAPDLDRIEYDENGRAINQDEPIRQRKLITLAKIQKGIDNDKVLAQTQAQEREQQTRDFAVEVQTTQEKFYDAFRENVTQDVIKNVKFSENPKLNVILANQNVAFLGQALEPGASGDAARAVLAESGIKFDFAKAQQLDKAIVEASVALAQAKKTKAADGTLLNQVEVNKATSQFKKATEAFQTFAKDILDQEARLVSTGTAEAVKAEVAKIKVAPKARVATNGTPTQAKKEDTLPKYGTDEWDRYWAKKTLEEQAHRAKAYA